MIIAVALMIGFASLAGIGMIGWWIDSVRRRRQHIAVRIAQARDVRRRTPVTRVSRDAARPERAWRQRLGVLFGYDFGTSTPIPWWGVLLVSLAVARGAAMLAAGLLGDWALVMVPPLWVGCSRMMFAHWQQHAATALLAQFPDALAMIGRAVRVGIPVTEAIRIAGRESPEPTGAILRGVADQIAIGISLETALKAAGDSTRLPEYRFFATALSLQQQTGGGLSETLENLGDVIRKRVAMRARGFALAAEARTSALVLSALPIVSGLMIYLMSPQYIGMLFTDPSGKSLLSIACGLLATGTVVMRLIIRKSLS